MIEFDASAMIQQLDLLADDFAHLFPVAQSMVASSNAALDFEKIENVHLLGNGDSYIACGAIKHAFERYAMLPVTSSSAHAFIHYGPMTAKTLTQRSLVVAVSTSGTTERVIEATRLAQSCGASTVAVVGRSVGPLGQMTEMTVDVSLQLIGKLPGTRSYQASLIGLLALAIKLGSARGSLLPADERAVQEELTELPAVLAMVNRQARAQAVHVAEALRDTSTLLVTGSGPGFATATFCAAKFVETSGLFAAAQDLDEWWHVERWIHAAETPMILIVPPFHAAQAAMRAAEVARDRGWRLITLSHGLEDPVAMHAEFDFRVQRTVSEELSPLVDCVFPAHLAAEVVPHRPMNSVELLDKRIAERGKS